MTKAELAQKTWTALEENLVVKVWRDGYGECWIDYYGVQDSYKVLIPKTRIAWVEEALEEEMTPKFFKAQEYLLGKWRRAYDNFWNFDKIDYLN